MGSVRRLRILAAATILLSIAVPSFADGKFFQRGSLVTPKIPSQQAIIAYRNGVETLIVSSAVESESAELGWVIPLPAEPTELAVADPGLLTSLAWCTRPNVTLEYSYEERKARILLFCSVAYMGLLILGRKGSWVRYCAHTVFAMVLLIILLGVVSRPQMGGLGDADISGVELMSAATVGNYNVSIIRANDPKPLAAWLEANGLVSLDEKSEPIVADYIERGWCFAVAKLARSEPGLAATHPIRVRFPVDAPVYPMKLTSLAESTTRIELFVVAEQQAHADGFRCTAADSYRPETWRMSKYTRRIVWRSSSADSATAHPDVVQLMWTGCVLTRLSADLSPAQMGEDVGIRFATLRPHLEHVHTARARRELVAAVIWFGLTVTLVVGGIVYGSRRRASGWRAAVIFTTLAITIVAAGVIYSQLDVRQTRSTRSPDTSAPSTWTIVSIALDLIEKGELTDAIAEKGAAAVTELLRKGGLPDGTVINPYTGETIRLERSPGNLAFRRVDGKTYLCLYGLLASESRIELPPAPVPEPAEAQPAPTTQDVNE